ncbi:hypothetical protein JCM8202v2_001972 [Rhodotorula sphaerocarpa]
MSNSSGPRPPRICAILMDQFGTLTDQHGSMTRLLASDGASAAAACGAAPEELGRIDWSRFAERWRAGYLRRTREIAQGDGGPGDIDELHLEASPTLLNELLREEEYRVLDEAWTPERRSEICQYWHRLDAWPDVKPALEQLRSREPPVLLATLSNGTLRLLIDVARHNNLPLDAHFSGDLLGSYKPNPVMYRRAADLLGFNAQARRRGQVAMFASHIDDLRAAAKEGVESRSSLYGMPPGAKQPALTYFGHAQLYTIYIRRPTEDEPERRNAVRAKREGGEVDLVIDSMDELVAHLQ